MAYRLHQFSVNLQILAIQLGYVTRSDWVILTILLGHQGTAHQTWKFTPKI